MTTLTESRRELAAIESRQEFATIGSRQEYFKCKRCYLVMLKYQIPRHHTECHPYVTHNVYLDTFFDLDRPMYKCTFCAAKLRPKKLLKHSERAHANKYDPFLRRLIQTAGNEASKSPVLPSFDISAATDLTSTTTTETCVSTNTSAVSQASPNSLLSNYPSSSAFVSHVIELSEDSESEDDSRMVKRPKIQHKSTMAQIETSTVATQTMERSKKAQNTERKPQLTLEQDEDGYTELVLIF